LTERIVYRLEITAQRRGYRATVHRAGMLVIEYTGGRDDTLAWLRNEHGAICDMGENRVFSVSLPWDGGGKFCNF